MTEIRASALFLCIGGAFLFLKLRIFGPWLWIYSLTCVGLLMGLMASSDDDLRAIFCANDDKKAQEDKKDALRPILFCTAGGMFLGFLIGLGYLIK